MGKRMVLDEKALGDIILCDPITKAGKEALYNLGLTTVEISPSFFYTHLRVPSRYDEKSQFRARVTETEEDKIVPLYYQYTVDAAQFKQAKDREAEFVSRFESDLPDEYPLLMLGVAGNGKTIEINRRIRKNTLNETAFECGKAYFDLENAFSKLRYEIEYECPDPGRPAWLFCINLLEGIMQYVDHCHRLSTATANNFSKLILSHNMANKQQQEVFCRIKNYDRADSSTQTALFESLVNLLGGNKPDRDIQELLELLMMLMFCTNPSQKNYIVFDNIEEYIRLNDSKVHVLDSDISEIYKAIKTVVANVTKLFNRIEENLAWKAFKVVIVIRRTSIGQLQPSLLQSPIRGMHNISDITGNFSVSEIWKNKRKHIWGQRLSNTITDEGSKRIIEIADIVMSDNEEAVGTGYQVLVAPLMSYGIRRNARAQAHAICQTNDLLSHGDNTIIDFEDFKLLLKSASSENNAVRYMFRRALIEFQFKWIFANGNESRWKRLGIGHLDRQGKKRFMSKNFSVEVVEYDNPACVTLLRRILAFLSYFPDENNIEENKKGKPVSDMFATISLYDLTRGVLLNPSGKNELTDDLLRQFAGILIALSDMSNEDTKSAPYVILNIRDSNFHQCESSTLREIALVDILKKILKAGPTESLPSHKYHCGDYGARITDAGYSFLLDWQASFSFAAALHCFTFPPLFFLKDPVSIKCVVESVFNASETLCLKYEREAERFCGTTLTLKGGKYLPKFGDRVVTFRQRVTELHINHLKLYQSYIERNYSVLKMNERTKGDIVSYIKEYIDKYGRKKGSVGERECF